LKWLDRLSEDTDRFGGEWPIDDDQKIDVAPLRPKVAERERPVEDRRDDSFPESIGARTG
jgi:hypothetical protein